MKQLLLLAFFTLTAITMFGQKGNLKKPAKTPQHKQASSKPKSSTAAAPGNIWEGTRDTDGKGPKPSKNQPAKVMAAFRRDYPTATNVSWSKYRGDWTATFQQGLITSTAVYHANGDRRDTRTVVNVKSLPAIILEEILKRAPSAQVGTVVKIDAPDMVREIFRIKTVQVGVTKYQFFDVDGKEVNYNY